MYHIIEDMKYIKLALECTKLALDYTKLDRI